jgi:exopolysaccharide biosynthesis polyprenyl glycosylphosphotransferase
VYDGRKNLRFIDELTSLSSATAMAAVTSAGALYLSFRDVSRLLFVLFVVFAFSYLLSWRGVYRLLRRWRGFPTQEHSVLIVGAGTIGKEVRQMIKDHGDFGISFVGYLDDEGNDDEVIGYLSDARKILEEKQIDDVVFALPGRAYERVNTLVTEIYDMPVRVWVIPDYFSIALHRAVIEEYAGIPMLDLRAPALNDYQRMIKRAFDLILTIIFLPPALLTMGIVSLAIRLDSPGEIIFRQHRVGENGRVFEMLKFRSMVKNAGQLSEPLGEDNNHAGQDQKAAGDRRITRIGKFIRRTSLDELPQLFNVLKGEMSLVGPRPELPYLVEKYEPWQRTRFAVPPGLTGWWQITGRSDKPMHLHTEDDLYYVQNYSLVLDITILLRTFWVVIRGKGAY